MENRGLGGPTSESTRQWAHWVSLTPGTPQHMTPGPGMGRGQPQHQVPGAGKTSQQGAGGGAEGLCLPPALPVSISSQPCVAQMEMPGPRPLHMPTAIPSCDICPHPHIARPVLLPSISHVPTQTPAWPDGFLCILYFHPTCHLFQEAFLDLRPWLTWAHLCFCPCPLFFSPGGQNQISFAL